jgi:glyoxylate/hydroxypyruvate reductase
MTLLLSIDGASENWAAPAWRTRFLERFEQRGITMPVVMAGDGGFAATDVHYAAVWKPPAGLLAGFPNLKAIFNLGAGVDAVLKDTTIPARIPLVRVVNADLTARMTEYVTLHVLMHHRRQRMLDAAQVARQWVAKDQWAASAVRVGLMGLGELGQDAAAVLGRIGFTLNGWSRSAKSVAGVRCYHGADGLVAFLAATDILVVLLPLTPDTRGILDRRLFQGLARDGVLGAPVLINAGRGGLQVEADILACLDDGTLAAATLDVFETEPLPATSRLWTHPRVTVTPHNAADSSPDAISADIVAQIAAHQSGQPLSNLVDRTRGY